jgi:hypothetical protein
MNPSKNTKPSILNKIKTNTGIKKNGNVFVQNSKTVIKQKQPTHIPIVSCFFYYIKITVFTILDRIFPPNIFFTKKMEALKKCPQ